MNREPHAGGPINVLKSWLPNRQRIKIAAARSLQACGAVDRARRRGGLVIFMLHKVNERPDSLGLNVSLGLLDSVIQEARRYCEIVDLPGVARRADGVTKGRLKIAFSFDDGYRDNYEQAYPVLRRNGIPATIYLSLDYLDRKRSFWYERLTDMIDNTRIESLDLRANGLGTYVFIDTASRQRALLDLNQQLKRFDDAARERLIETIMQRQRHRDEK